jgi:hypothetical protein
MCGALPAQQSRPIGPQAPPPHHARTHCRALKRRRAGGGRGRGRVGVLPGPVRNTRHCARPRAQRRLRATRGREVSRACKRGAVTAVIGDGGSIGGDEGFDLYRRRPAEAGAEHRVASGPARCHEWRAAWGWRRGAHYSAAAWEPKVHGHTSREFGPTSKPAEVPAEQATPRQGCAGAGSADIIRAMMPHRLTGTSALRSAKNARGIQAGTIVHCADFSCHFSISHPQSILMQLPKRHHYLSEDELFRFTVCTCAQQNQKRRQLESKAGPDPQRLDKMDRLHVSET